MKSLTFATLLCAAQVTLLSSSHAATVITQWTFETSIPATGGPHAAEVGTGSATGVHASGATVFSNPVGNGSLESFSANTWAVNDYFQFSMATTGFEDILVSWAQTSSSTGPGEFKLAYQVNGGGFTDFVNYTVLPNQAAAPGLGAWTSATAFTGYNFSFDLSAITGLDNAASVDFRLIMRSTRAFSI